MRAPETALQRKLLGWLLGPLLALLVLDTAYSYWSSHNFSHLAHDRSLYEIGREIALHVKPASGEPRLELSPAARRILLDDLDDTVYFRISGADGRTVGGDEDFPSPPALPVRAGRPVYYATEFRGQPVRAAAFWSQLEDPSLGKPVLVQVAETVNKRNALARDILLNAVLPQLALILMATVAVYIGVSRGLRPLLRLAQAVSRRSHVDLSPIDTEGVPAEVRPLVDEVNELMQRLGKVLDFQSRFVADAAHQMKTPVSGLKAQIELALRENDPQAVRHSLGQLYVSADRLSRLVRQLLSLARNEPSAATSVRMEPMSLKVMAFDASMDWVPAALEAGVDLGFEGGDDPLMIEADADRVRELINNLVDNAIRYSHRGGRVTVQVGRAGEADVELTVRDDGPRIPVQERQRIFERFHRMLGTSTDGSGLGLAIVSEIARLHGARIELEEDDDGVGNRFTVRFRRAPADASLGA
ncbi:MAG: sensor histidine kinase N-terminal domain-containing protein [Burkholderiales bacterium]|nr:sensor histidine kinase N-terminal domain-containing protein [Burkholderiales bacterium]